MIVFVWQIIQYIKARWSGGGGPELAPVLYSVVALAVVVGLWGVVNFIILATVGTDTADPFYTPFLPYEDSDFRT